VLATKFAALVEHPAGLLRYSGFELPEEKRQAAKRDFLGSR